MGLALVACCKRKIERVREALVINQAYHHSSPAERDGVVEKKAARHFMVEAEPTAMSGVGHRPEVPLSLVKVAALWKDYGNVAYFFS